MKTLFLPVEVQDRGFLSKLLVALKILSKKKGVQILIGHDKVITDLINHTNLTGALLDKSCSNIMYWGRIKPIKEKGGFVAVLDEEGINNIPGNEKYYLTRFFSKAAKHIDYFFAWGSLDQMIAKNANIEDRKIVVTGNPRFDFYSKSGITFYERDCNAIHDLFGEYFLFSDNIVIEHFDGNYIPPPRPHLSKEDRAYLDVKRKNIKDVARSRRNLICEQLKEIALELPHKNILIRPHPVSNPTFWIENLYSYRNIHIIYKYSADPWIIASKGLLSAGCTTALQAGLCNKPIYHLGESNNLPASTNLAAKLGYSYIDLFKDDQYRNKPSDQKLIRDNIRLSDDLYSFAIVSEYLIMMLEESPMSSSISSMSVIKELKSLVNKTSYPNTPKWSNVPSSIQWIHDTIKRLANSFNITLPKISIFKVSNHCYLLTNETSN